MALSKSEYFKNIFTTIVQSTGSVVNAQSPEEMRAFVRAAKIDAAINVRNWNKFVYPIMKTLRSSPEHEFDVLDVDKGGLSGWTITTEHWATEDSMECLWDGTRQQPHSITGSILCLAAKIAAVAAEKTEWEEYDDTDLKALIECIELNLEQAKKDMFGECYTWDCDGNANLPYPLARHVHEIFTQLVTGAPSLGLDGCFTGDYPTLMIEHRVSTLIYDDLIPAGYIEYCGDGSTLTDALAKIHSFVGQDDCNDGFPNYSSLTVPGTAPSSGNLILVDDESLRMSLKRIDGKQKYYNSINTVADGGTITSGTGVAATGPLETLTIKAGTGITIESKDDSASPGLDWIKISSVATSSGGAGTLQESYIAGSAGTAGQIILDNTFPNGGTIIVEDDSTKALTEKLFQVRDSIANNWTPIWDTGKHQHAGAGLGSTSSHKQSTGVDAGPSSFDLFCNDSHSAPLYLTELSSLTPDTMGASHPTAGVGVEDQGVLWVSAGDQSVTDRDGNAQIKGHLYYRQPSSGDIWHLLCCGTESGGSGGTTKNLAQTYDVDSTTDGKKDGGKIILDGNANEPGLNLYDGASSAFNTSNWLSLYKGPAFSVLKNAPSVDADAYFSISQPQNGEEVAVNNHLTPVNFSLRDTTPSTPTHQGSLYAKSGTGHIYWRNPSNGTEYDLTATGAGGGSGSNLWNKIILSTASSHTGGTASGGPIEADTTSDELTVRAGDYIQLKAGPGDDDLEISVNAPPIDFLSDVNSPVADRGLGDYLRWNDSTNNWVTAKLFLTRNVSGGGTPTSSANIVSSIDDNVLTGEYSYYNFRRLIAGSGITLSYTGTDNNDIMITAPSAGSSTTTLSDVSDLSADTVGQILTWDGSEFDPSTFDNVGGAAKIYKSYDAAGKTHDLRTLKSTGSHMDALVLEEEADRITFRIKPEEINAEDLGNIDDEVPSTDGSLLVWNNSTKKWTPAAPESSEASSAVAGSGFAPLWLKPSDWDMRSVLEEDAQEFAEALTSQEHTLDPDDAWAGSDGSYATGSGHFENSVARIAYEPYNNATADINSPGTYGLGTTDQWIINNSIRFLHGRNAFENSQFCYVTFPIPRRWTGNSQGAGWEYPTKMYVTAYFCGPTYAMQPVINSVWGSIDSVGTTDMGIYNKARYSLSLPDDRYGASSGGMALPMTWIEGTSLHGNYLSEFGEDRIYEDGVVSETKKQLLNYDQRETYPIKKYSQISVLRFGTTTDTLEGGATEHPHYKLNPAGVKYPDDYVPSSDQPDGMLTLRLAAMPNHMQEDLIPESRGKNIFLPNNALIHLPHHFLGMRLDFR